MQFAVAQALNAGTAVELTRGEDHISIWVDANNNGVRDDEDVNIFLTKNGGFYTESPTFKGIIDTVLRDKMKQAASLLMQHAGDVDAATQQELCDLALAFVLKASKPAEEVAASVTASAPAPMQGGDWAKYTA